MKYVSTAVLILNLVSVQTSAVVSSSLHLLPLPNINSKCRLQYHFDSSSSLKSWVYKLLLLWRQHHWKRVASLGAPASPSFWDSSKGELEQQLPALAVLRIKAGSRILTTVIEHTVSIGVPPCPVRYWWNTGELLQRCLTVTTDDF